MKSFLPSVDWPYVTLHYYEGASDPMSIAPDKNIVDVNETSMEVTNVSPKT